MASVNKVIIVGNLGNDPEVRTLPNGDTVANISVATTEYYKDRQSGENKELTEWHRINFFGRLAEIVGQYLRKGSPVYVEGSLRTRKWQDQSGQTRYSTEIRAENMQMLGTRSDNNSPRQTNNTYNQPTPNAQNAPPSNPVANPNMGFGDLDDDVPF